MEQHEIDGIKNLLLSDYEPNVQVGFKLLKGTFMFTKTKSYIFIIDNVLPVVFDMICSVLQKYCKETFSDHLTKLDSGKEIFYYEWVYNDEKEVLYRDLFLCEKTKICRTDYFRFSLREFIAKIENYKINNKKNAIDVNHILSLLKTIFEYLHEE
jgi:hypothetical protein